MIFSSSTPVLLNGPIFSTFPVNDGLGADKETFINGTTQYQTPFDLGNGTSIPSKMGLSAFLRTTPFTGLVKAAHLCALCFCVRQYNVTVNSGIVSSNVFTTSYGKLTSNNTIDQSSYSFFNSDRNFTFAVASSERRVPSPSGTSIEVLLDLALQNILQGKLTRETTEFSPKIEPTATNQIIYGFNASTDIPATMDRVATAMTIHSRYLSNLTVSGQTGSTET